MEETQKEEKEKNGIWSVSLKFASICYLIMLPIEIVFAVLEWITYKYALTVGNVILAILGVVFVPLMIVIPLYFLSAIVVFLYRTFVGAAAK